MDWQTDGVVALTVGTLGEDLLGIYLHGSSVLGGLRPASDLDLLVATRRSLTDTQRRALVAGLMPISGPGNGGRHLELTIVVQSHVRPWRYPPEADLLYGDWLRADFESGVLPWPGPMPNLALEITLALRGDRALLGPPPAQVLDPVPPADLARASLDGIPGLISDLAGDERNVALTVARIWSTLTTGEILTKDEAAAWALPRLPPQHRPALDHARELYLTTTYQDETWPEGLKDQVRPLVHAMLSRLPS
jgi:streptomycin 3"-adenylyltransferase